MYLHVGKIVEKLIRENGMSYTEFAVKMNYSKQNITSLLKNESWQSKQIWEASVILKVNIFKIFGLEIESHLKGKKTKMDLKDNIELLKLENEYLEKEVKIYKKYFENK